MLEDQTVEPTDYSLLDKALQGGFRQGEFNVIFGRPRRRVFPLELDEPERLRLSDALRKYHNSPDFITLIQGVDSDDFPS